MWDNIKTYTYKYLQNEGEKKFNIILNKEKTKIIGLDSIFLNIQIRFYTYIIKK